MRQLAVNEAESFSSVKSALLSFASTFAPRVTPAAAVTKKLSLLEWLEVTSVTFCPLFRHDPKN
jgi:hypothetical protein